MDEAEKQKILEEIGGLPEDVYDELVRVLIAQTHEQIANIGKALNEDDYDTIAKAAHLLKGSSGNLRIYAIHDIAKAIEETSTQEKARDDLPGDLKKLEGALAQLEQEFPESAPDLP